ncbi:hypothetical protein CQA53_06285 [Helicobacter didelphidarum]|uniref:Uncharacterized protein n=1 Tax=Helicobacter didelphidarum TaxID=2040648 RepID=A0A3D8IJP0_9HELI|nr:hypothetical protein CQA53_06285 [Helicobacter didelphidarum]
MDNMIAWNVIFSIWQKILEIKEVTMAHEILALIMLAIVGALPIVAWFYVKHKDKQHREKLKDKG